MTSITGSKAPLHRRFDEKDALRQIRSRYIAMRADILDQVRLLQSEKRFLDKCQAFYASGYKDWHILSAIYNLMMQLLAKESGYNFRKKEEVLLFQAEAPKRIQGKISPLELFLQGELDTMFELHAMTCLNRLGFEIRAPIAGTSLLRFLRERMRHFDLDIPHAPMFIDPPSDWPELENKS